MAWERHIAAWFGAQLPVPLAIHRTELVGDERSVRPCGGPRSGPAELTDGRLCVRDALKAVFEGIKSARTRRSAGDGDRHRDGPHPAARKKGYGVPWPLCKEGLGACGRGAARRTLPGQRPVSRGRDPLHGARGCFDHRRRRGGQHRDHRHRHQPHHHKNHFCDLKEIKKEQRKTVISSP